MSNLTLMSLTGISSDNMFLCTAVSTMLGLLQLDSIKAAETYAFMASLAAYF